MGKKNKEESQRSVRTGVVLRRYAKIRHKRLGAHKAIESSYDAFAEPSPSSPSPTCSAACRFFSNSAYFLTLATSCFWNFGIPDFANLFRVRAHSSFLHVNTALRQNGQCFSPGYHDRSPINQRLGDAHLWVAELLRVKLAPALRRVLVDLEQPHFITGKHSIQHRNRHTPLTLPCIPYRLPYSQVMHAPPALTCAVSHISTKQCDLTDLEIAAKSSENMPPMKA